MSIGSLFAGIGGLELGLEAAGLGPVTFVELCAGGNAPEPRPVSQIALDFRAP